MTNEDAHRIAALAVRQRLAWVALKNARETEPLFTAREDYHQACDELEDALIGLSLEQINAAPVFAGPDESVDGVIADLRRLYHHLAGGNASANPEFDATRISRGIAALERAQARQHACLAT